MILRMMLIAKIMALLAADSDHSDDEHMGDATITIHEVYDEYA